MKNLDSIYGPGTFLAPRLIEENSRWITGDLHTIEFMTSRLLTCAGEMPIICHRATLSPDGLAAIRDAGLSIADNCDGYTTRTEYIDVVNSRLANFERPAFVFSNPMNIFNSDVAVVENRLIQEINNKSAIEKFVPKNALPNRRHLDNKNTCDLKNEQLPIVVKVATDDPNAGGSDVLICRRRRHLKQAEARFCDSGYLILEDFIDAKTNWCLQYATDHSGQITYIGSSMQLCSKKGSHQGNLISPDSRPPDSAVNLGYNIMAAGTRMGFRGVAGFDFLVNHQDKVFAIDLNFRPVSSTGFVLNYEKIIAIRKLTTARLAYCVFDGKLLDFLRSCKKGLDMGWLIPLATFDPVYGNLGYGPSCCSMVILGHSTKDIKAKEVELVAAGIHVVGGRRKWHHSVRRKLKRIHRIIAPRTAG